MDDDEPLPSYEGLAAAFAKAKADKERDEAQGLRATTGDAAAANKQGEVHFKASHGILIAFFTWILYELALLLQGALLSYTLVLCTL
jgi:phosphatidylinositol glycan class O